MKIAIILGTRPEIIKLSPLMRLLESRSDTSYCVIHSNQHYTSSLDRVFFAELGLVQANYHLDVGSGTDAQQTAKILLGAEPILQAEQPDIVLVQGDTNTVLGGALTAAKLGIKIGHVEAGLRSFDRTMPEELNRIVTDHLASLLFTPTKGASDQLLQEGIAKESIFLTGNTIVDAVQQNATLADKQSDILERLGLKHKGYIVLTMHRPSNVDHKGTLVRIMHALLSVAEESGLAIIFPVHPRTEKNIHQYKIKIPAGLNTIAPLGFLDMLMLEKNARLIITDSGGVQEEACILGVPCVTLRDSTERPETVDAGANVLVGSSSDAITSGCRAMLKNNRHWDNPFGDGHASEHIIEAIVSSLAE